MNMSRLTLMSDVFKSQDLFLNSLENMDFKLKANKDIL